MKKFNFFRVIVLTILVLPLIYGYFAILPESTKFLLDLILLGYLIYFRRVIQNASGFVKLYLIYIGLVLILNVCSIIIHQENFSLLIPELRRLLIPLFLYYVISDVFRAYPEASVDAHRFFLMIMLIQIPVTVVQSVFFTTFVKMGLFSGYRHYMDAAAGTLGVAGHTYLGVLIPLTFLYLYDLKLFKYMLPFLIPLILINSGGGIVLFGIVMVCIGVYTLITGSLKQKTGIVIGIGVFIGLVFVFSQTAFFKANFYSYTRSFLFYSENYIDGGRETFVGQEHKISRINGYKFLNKRMDRHDFEQLFGLGFEFKNNKIRGYTLSFKNDLNTILAERGYLGLVVHIMFMIAFIWYVYDMLKKNGYRRLFVKMLFFASFFIAGIYNQTSRSFTVWLILIFYMVLLENRPQYMALLEYLGLKRKKRKRSSRHTRKPATQPVFQQWNM